MSDVIDAFEDVRGALGARHGESTLAAAQRVVAERDTLAEHLESSRERVRQLLADAPGWLDRMQAAYREGDVDDARAALGAAADEDLGDAARRVVRERDEARARLETRERAFETLRAEIAQLTRERNRWHTECAAQSLTIARLLREVDPRVRAAVREEMAVAGMEVHDGEA